MAVFSAVFTFSAELASTATLSTVTASSEIVLGRNRNFIVTATAAFNLSFGTSGMAAPTASNFEFPGSAVFTMSTSTAFDRIRIFNPTGGNVTYWVQPLAD